MKNIVDFDAKFTLVETPFSDSGIIETYGEELDYLLKFIAAAPDNIKHVFTIIDGEEDNNMYAAAGYHLVNRLGYVITNEPWEDVHEEYIWFEAPDDEE